jgi:hypothetical protein
MKNLKFQLSKIENLKNITASILITNKLSKKKLIESKILKVTTKTKWFSKKSLRSSKNSTNWWSSTIRILSVDPLITLTETLSQVKINLIPNPITLSHLCRDHTKKHGHQQFMLRKHTRNRCGERLSQEFQRIWSLPSTTKFSRSNRRSRDRLLLESTIISISNKLNCQVQTTDGSSSQSSTK